MFGVGGGTSSFAEIEDADLILLWGSNARDAHPIFFHHLLKGIKNGARMWAIDPRRTSSAKFADTWLGLEVGSDIALANALAREIIHNGHADEEFIANATSGYAEFAASVEDWTPERASDATKLPTAEIRALALAIGQSKKVQICWTLGITEHHTGVDNVHALINLALLTGNVGRWGSGLVPLRGQNNVQGGGDMGAIPLRLPGFTDVSDAVQRERCEREWGASLPDQRGWHMSEMFDAMHERALRALWVIGENPADSEADADHARAALSGLDILVVQDLYLTRTAQLADVVFPAAAAWAESDGTVTNSERRVQRVRRAVAPPGEAHDDLEIIFDVAKICGHDWGSPDAEVVWDELRRVSPSHAGMTYARLSDLGGLQWPCLDESDPGAPFLHGRLWQQPLVGARAPFAAVEWRPPLDTLDDDYPFRLTTGRVIDSYNTGVQTERYPSPIRTGDTLDICRADASSIGVTSGDRVAVASRRGAIEMTIRIVEGLPRGLVFSTMHFPGAADVNRLISDAWDPKSGTAEFKATAVRIDRCASEIVAQ